MNIPILSLLAVLILAGNTSRTRALSEFYLRKFRVWGCLKGGSDTLASMLVNVRLGGRDSC